MFTRRIVTYLSSIQNRLIQNNNNNDQYLYRLTWSAYTEAAVSQGPVNALWNINMSWMVEWEWALLVKVENQVNKGKVAIEYVDTVS